MNLFPLPLTELFGQWGAWSVYLVIGMAFGATLESAGFGNSMKLSAQFYFRDMTVFKVMFTAIITASTLVFLSSALGILDYNLIWVPPTYLWPGIVGGLIMGVGFIVGGFCPGTSLVGMATGKLDAIFFVGGVLFGIFMFGETVSYFDVFFESSFMGRFTLPELFGVSYGTVLVYMVVGALAMFWVTEKVEARMGGKSAQKAPRWSIPAGAALTALAVAALMIGQPDNNDRWNAISAEKQAQLDNREAQATAAEVLNLVHDSRIKTLLYDVRGEADYNQFHIQDARHLPLELVQAEAEAMHFEPANTVFVLMSNDETLATQAWKILKAESVPNVYILEGGINEWLDTWASEAFRQQARFEPDEDERLAWRFRAATGSRHPAAEPNPYALDLEYEPKVILELKRAPTCGGCG
jgi:rhodanese-related sulfurtransferase